MSKLDLDFVSIPEGSFLKGSFDFYPEEAPTKIVDVSSFSVSRFPITNRQFDIFVKDTGYRTTAELELTPEEFPNLTNAERNPGSLVFVMTDGPVNLNNWQNWWKWKQGASWKIPGFKEISYLDILDHPVTQISIKDAETFAKWAGCRLLTEDEWEYASGSDLSPTTYSWGTELMPNGIKQANYWSGKFPYQNTDLYWETGTSPVGSFPANKYGLYDMIGNVWEWTSTMRGSHFEKLCLCSPVETFSITSERDRNVEYVTKGGSFLCSEEYCKRYRPAAKSFQNTSSSTCNLGFRVAKD
jgi:formylglycine-generating enzyme required for sulfatase activity